MNDTPISGWTIITQKKLKKDDDRVAVVCEEVEVDDFNNDDYGFIFGSNGELKSIMFPEELMGSPPAKILKILKIFGIKDLHLLEPRTLH